MGQALGNPLLGTFNRFRHWYVTDHQTDLKTVQDPPTVARGAEGMSFGTADWLASFTVVRDPRVPGKKCRNCTECLQILIEPA